MRHRVLSKWPVRFSPRFSPSWGEYRRRGGGGLRLCSLQGLVAPSVSLPMVGCHLPQEGRKRATYSQVSQPSATVHRTEEVPTTGELPVGLEPTHFGSRVRPESCSLVTSGFTR